MVQVSSMTLAAGISGITQRTQINSEVADINSLHSGTSRPAYLTDGLWLKTTSSVLWELMYYDGNTDIVLNQINPTTHLVVAEPIAQGGTGATTAAAARTNLSAAVLGTNNDITSMTALSSINGGQLAGLRNRIINGDMRIDQRAVGAAVTITGSGYASLDRWLMYSTQSSKYSIQRITGAGPTGLFNTILKATSLSAYAPLTGDYFNILQRIEGQNIIDLGFGTANAKAITLSFWVQSTLTGTFGGTLNNASSRAFPFTYVINAANTWEYKTLIVAGDTSGTWLLDNSVGLVASFSLGCGATNLGTAGAWNSSSSLGATGQVNMVATNASTLLLTGVQLEIGSVATPFEQRPISMELALCQRYCFAYRPATNYSAYGCGHGINTTSARIILKLPQTMRVNPTFYFSAANTFTWSFGNVLSNMYVTESGNDMFSIDIISTGLTAFYSYLLTSNNNLTSYIIGSAEL